MIILYSSGYLHQTPEIVKANSYPIAEYNVILVNGGGLLRTRGLTIGSPKIDADVDHTSLLLQVMGLMSYTKDYATSEVTNTFYYEKERSVQRGIRQMVAVHERQTVR